MRNDAGHHSLSGKVIHIVGPGRLQNELMAFFLEHRTGAKGMTGEDLHSVQGIDYDHGRQSNLVLFDCRGKDLESFIGGLESYGQDILSRIFVALFNVGPDLGIEEEAVARGARGFFYEQDTLDRFSKGVAAIFDGELWVSKDVMSKFVPRHKTQGGLSRRDATGITPRETEILALVAVGAKNEEIADKLGISPHTVKTHIYNMCKKIGVPNRLQAALWAAKNL